MRNFSLIAVALSSTVLIAITGCGGGDFAPVTGTVTYDGEPVSNLKVIFSPEPIGDKSTIGPYSKGVTDESGQFTLVTRYKDPGAFVGKHRLSFEYKDISAMALGDLQSDMNDAKDAGDKEEFSKVKERIAKMKAKLKGRPILANFEPVIVDVPSGGIGDYQLDLKEIEKEKE